jgi:undecaprenyl pyrophosphate synthase
MEYIKQKLSDNEIDADKVWRKIPNAKEKNYVRNLSFEYDGKKYIVDSIDQTIKETTDEEIEKNYITNPEEHEYTYYGG